MGEPRIYSQEYYQRIAELEERHWWHTGMREIAAALLRSVDCGPSDCGLRIVDCGFGTTTAPSLPDNPQSAIRNPQSTIRSVLDAGCGTGATMAWAQDLLGRDDHRGRPAVAGVDISGEAIGLSRPRAGQFYAQASVLRLPFRSESFDLLLCWDVLQHLPTDGGDLCALKEMQRVLRPGGLLLVRSNSRLGMWQQASARDDDFQRYTLPELVAQVEAAGFIVKRTTYANALPALYSSLKRGAAHFGFWILDFGFRCTPNPKSKIQNPKCVYEGLSIRDTPSRSPWLNRLLWGIMKMEALYLSRAGRSLAFGHSTWCLAMKPPAPVGGPPVEVRTVASAGTGAAR